MVAAVSAHTYLLVYVCEKLLFAIDWAFEIVSFEMDSAPVSAPNTVPQAADFIIL
jgi:hypothetical protein